MYLQNYLSYFLLKLYGVTIQWIRLSKSIPIPTQNVDFNEGHAMEDMVDK